MLALKTTWVLVVKYNS